MLGSDRVPQVTSSLLEGDIACSNQTVIFTCTVHGSIIWWGSETYVGPINYHLEIPSSRDPGYSIPSLFNEDTVATLLDYDPITGVLTAQLRLVALLNLSLSTITCGNTNTGETVAINFTVTGRSSHNKFYSVIRPSSQMSTRAHASRNIADQMHDCDASER